MVSPLEGSDRPREFPGRFNELVDKVDGKATTGYVDSVAHGPPVTVSRDANGNLDEVTSALGTFDAFSRDTAGRIESYDLDGTTFEVARDDGGRVTGVSEVSA